MTKMNMIICINALIISFYGFIMKVRFILLIGLIFSINMAIATPNLYVQFDKVYLESDELIVKVTRSRPNKLESISIDTKKAKFSVPSRLLKKIWGPNLQGIELSHSVNLTKLDKPQNYQMYIKFVLYTTEGWVSTEDEKLENYEMEIYFDEKKLKSIRIRKDGKHIENIYNIP